MQYSAGIVIKDGDLLWILDDARDGACVGDVVLRPVLKAGYLEANGQEVSASKYPRLLRWAKNSDMLISEEKYKLNCAKYVYDKVRDKLKLPNVSNRFLQARGGGCYCLRRSRSAKYHRKILRRPTIPLLRRSFCI